MSDKTTKKTSETDTMRSEYRFDYSEAKPNRFAADFKDHSVAFVLDPDVALVFKSSKSVNKALRSVIESLSDQQD